MKAKKNSSSTKGKSSGKRAVRDLPAKSAASVKGGAIVQEARKAGKGQQEYLLIPPHA
jgi:hypothetical protein